MENLYDNIFGKQTLVFYLSWMIFSFTGFLIFKFIMFKRRKGVKRSFKIRYFISDNLYDIFFGIITMFIVGRFQEDFSSYLNPKWNIENVMLKAFAFGFMFTTIMQIIRKTKFGNFLKSSTYSDGAKREI